MTQQQFTQFVTQYQNLVYTVCFHLVSDSQQAQDLTQETFVSAWLHRESCIEVKEKAWLCRIASNKAKDYLKSAAVRKVTVCQKETLDLLPATYSSPSEQAERGELYATIEKNILSLKEPYGSVCRGVFLQGLSPKEISHLLNRPVQTVQTQLFRGKKLLQAQLSNVRAVV